MKYAVQKKNLCEDDEAVSDDDDDDCDVIEDDNEYEDDMDQSYDLISWLILNFLMFKFAQNMLIFYVNNLYNVKKFYIVILLLFFNNRNYSHLNLNDAKACSE